MTPEIWKTTLADKEETKVLEVTKAPGKRAATPPQDQQDTRCFPLQVEMRARHCDGVKDSS